MAFDFLLNGERVGDGSGAEADVAVLGVRTGTFGFIDSGGFRMPGTQKLECELTVKAGQVVWDLNGRSRPLWSAQPPAALQ